MEILEFEKEGKKEKANIPKMKKKNEKAVGVRRGLGGGGEERGKAGQEGEGERSESKGELGWGSEGIGERRI